MKKTLYLIIGIIVVVSIFSFYKTGAYRFEWQEIPDTVVVNSCLNITKSGSYVLGADIVNKTEGSCINVINTDNVELDCQDYTVTSEYEKYAVKLEGSSGFEIRNCNLESRINVVIDQGTHSMLMIDNSMGGLVSNSFVGGNFTNVRNSSSVIIENSVFIGELQFYRSDHSVIRDNSFSGTAGSLLTLIEGNNNSVIGNEFDGQSDGVYQPDSIDAIGSDDAIVIKAESNDLIQENIMKNFWDCGIENDEFVFGSQMIGNEIENTGVCGIGGWYRSSVRGNTIKDNLVSYSPRMFLFFRFEPLQPNEDFIYFSDNTFEDNVFINPKVMTGHNELTDASKMSIGNSLISPEDVIVENNILRNNNFGAISLPIVLSPFSGFIDDGGNICPPVHPTDIDLGFPIDCNQL